VRACIVVVLLGHENLGGRLGCDVFQSFTLLADHKSDVFVKHFDASEGILEWVGFSDVDLRLVGLPVLSNNRFNCFLRD
jgi:hypothetical protein